MVERLSSVGLTAWLQEEKEEQWTERRDGVSKDESARKGLRMMVRAWSKWLAMGPGMAGNGTWNAWRRRRIFFFFFNLLSLWLWQVFAASL